MQKANKLKKKLKKANKLDMQHHLYAYWVNGHRLDKANLKNNSRQYIHTCCFEAEFRICVLKIAVLRKKTEKPFLEIFEKSL